MRGSCWTPAFAWAAADLQRSGWGNSGSVGVLSGMLLNLILTAVTVVADTSSIATGFVVDVAIGVSSDPENPVPIASNVNVTENIHFELGKASTATIGYEIPLGSGKHILMSQVCSLNGCRYTDIDTKHVGSMIQWDLQEGTNKTHSYRLTYYIPSAVSTVGASPYSRIRLRTLSQRISPVLTVDPNADGGTQYFPSSLETKVQVNGWNSEQQWMICGSRQSAVYARSAFEVTSRNSCAACLVSDKDGHDEVEGDCQQMSELGGSAMAYGTTINNLASADGPHSVRIHLTTGTIPKDGGLASFDRGARCRTILYDQNPSRIDEFFGEITYPLKALLLLTPIGFILMVIGIGLVRVVAVLAPIIAISANLFDITALGGLAVYPMCTMAVTGKLLSIADMITLIVFVIGTIAAFSFLDRKFAKGIKLEEAIARYSVQSWGSILRVMLPVWFPCWFLTVSIFLTILLCPVTQLLSPEEVLWYAITVHSWIVGIELVKALQPRIREARKAHKTREFQLFRFIFIIFLLAPPFTAYWLFWQPERYTAISAALIVLLGVPIFTRLRAKPASSTAPQIERRLSASKSTVAPSLLKKLRPKQRALLEAQLQLPK